MKTNQKVKEFNNWARAEKEAVIQDHVDDIHAVDLYLKGSKNLKERMALIELINLLNKSLKAVRATKVIMNNKKAE